MSEGEDGVQYSVVTADGRSGLLSPDAAVWPLDKGVDMEVMRTLL